MAIFRNFIFDWSGTLVDDLPPVVHATNAVLAHCGRPTLTRGDFLREFELPFQRFYDRLLPGMPLAELEPVFHAAFAQSGVAAAPLPHAGAFLHHCRQAGHRCFVLSAAHPAHLLAQSDAFGFTPFFEEIYAGVRDKSERIHHLLETHALDPAETAFIGDMTHDIETALHGGVTAVAVLTGYQDEARLRSASPHHVFADLAEFASFLGVPSSGWQTDF